MRRDDNKTDTTNSYLIFIHWLFLADYVSIWVAHLPSWIVSSFQLQHLAKSFSLHWLPKILGCQLIIKNKTEIFFNAQRQDLILSSLKALTIKRIMPHGKGKKGKSSREVVEWCGFALALEAEVWNSMNSRTSRKMAKVPEC